MKFILSILLFVASTASATNYYFATAGNDVTGLGTFASPWKTPAKATAVWALSTTAPGDTFFFKRGDVFYGSIIAQKSGTAARPIVLTYYGSGVNPTVTGWTTVTGWAAIGNGVWVSAPITNGLASLNMVAINNVVTGMGRFPNDDAANGGYNTVTDHNLKISITDNTLASTPDWTGAEMVLRERHWILNRNLITDHTGTVLTYSGGTYEVTNGFGYFIQKSIKTLNKLGEWYYDPATQKLYMYSGSTNPGTTVKAATQTTLFNSVSKSYIKIEGITFDGANGTNVNFSGGVGNKVYNNTVKNSGINSIMVSSTFVEVVGDSVLWSMNNGIESNSPHDVLVKNNVVLYTSTITGLGQSSESRGIAIAIRSVDSNAVVKFNDIQYVGYNGIMFKNTDVATACNNIYIDSNRVAYAGKNKDDGAAIYTVQHNDIQYTNRNIRGNILQGHNVSSAIAGTNSSTSSFYGIYLDERSSDIAIQNNYVDSFGRAGPFWHTGNRRVTMSGNTVFNNGLSHTTGGAQFYIFQQDATLLSLNTVTNNIFFSQGTEYNVRIDNLQSSLPTFLAFNGNYYVNASTKATPFLTQVSNSSTARTFNTTAPTWKALNWDIASSQILTTSTSVIRSAVNFSGESKSVDLTSGGVLHNWKDGKGNNYTSLALAPYTGIALIMGSVVTGTNPVASASATSILCNGGSSTVTVSATSGTPPYTGTGTFTKSAGTSSFIVSDANNLKDTVSVTITEPTALSLTESHTAITINGGVSTVTFSGSGGTGSKQYKLDGGSLQSSAVFSNVLAGNHTGTIQDANGCLKTISFSITQPSPNPVVGSASVTQPLCNGGSGTIIISATGGTSPYTGTGTFVRAAGSYSFIVADALSQKDTVFVTITAPAALTLSQSHTAINVFGNNSTVTLTASGGTGTKSYKISGSYQSSNVFTLTAGTYTASVRDANLCVTSITFTITEPAQLDAAASVTDSILCFGGTTVITVAVSGGISPYTGSLGNHVVGPGTYSYPIQDAAGAKDTARIVVTQPALLSLSSSHGTISVNGGTTTLTFTASGGTGIDSFKLGNGAYQASNVFTVNAGSYTGTVKDANGCTATTSGNITQPAPVNPPPNASASFSTILCNGGTASVTISATGTSPFTGTGVFTQSAGTVSYIVSNIDGKDTVDVTLTEPALLTLSQSYPAIATNGGSTTLTLSAAGGTGSKTYSTGGSYQSSPIFASVTAGAYTVSVKDANNCITSNSIVISEPASTPPTATAQWDSILCYGGNTAVNIDATGGIAPYTGIGSFVVPAGTWTFTVIDSAGISDDVTVTVTQPLPLSLSVTASDTLGVILVAAGGSGVDSFRLNNGAYQLSPVFNSLSSGRYTATVKDSNGCEKNITFTLGTIPPGQQKIRSYYKLKYP